MAANDSLLFSGSEKDAAVRNIVGRIQQIHSLLDVAFSKLHELIDGEKNSPVSFVPIATVNEAEPDIEIAKRLLKIRRKREKYIPSFLLGEPAWDILLDLYVAEHENRRISISSLCIASSVPATTALRWIRTLEQQGFICRESDTNDGRRIYTKMSDKARSLLKNLLTESAEIR